MSGADSALRGPLASSVRLGFVMLYAAVLVLGVGWASGNIRQVPPDSRAVVQRFGRVVRVQPSGLLIAWPAPIEQVWLLPSSDRQMSLKIQGQKTGFVSDETDQVVIQKDDVIHMQGNRDLNNANYLLTGDGNVVRLDTTLFYTITDPAAYLLEKDHVEAALKRVYLASAVVLTASRSLDDFLVARPDDSGKDTNVVTAVESVATLAARRQALRGDLVAAINRRLSALRASGEDLGVLVGRVDLVALLPPIAKNAFDAVLTASQIADQGIAAARTDAARTTQEADRTRDQLLTEASASAEERVRQASADVAPVAALTSQETPDNRTTLLTHAYQEQIATILKQAGDVTAVDARGGQGLVLPGAAP
jgi:regulator of protease activity HflC (stomatin/prohibitin superfamily)